MSDKNIPRHIAIIMDGNGRWAKKRFMPRMFGHQAGVETVRKIVKYSSQLGVSYLTLYAFSSENWTRPFEEVSFLMDLLKKYIEKEQEFLNENNVRVRFIGREEGLSSEILSAMRFLEDVTKNNTGLGLTLAVNYGAYNEILDAVQNLIDYARENHIIDLKEEFEKRLTTASLPNPDLLIRTAGERRLSNFLLWQLAYSEFHFTETLWPDFDEKSLDAALDDYQKRERRYGGLL